MPASALFHSIFVRIQELEVRFLPAIRIDLAYTPEEYDRLSAYILLVHAEVESFLEERVLAEVAERLRKWDTQGVPSVVLMGLLAFHRGEWPATVQSATAPNNPTKSPTWMHRELSTRLAACHTQFNHTVRIDNHGLKAANLLSLVLPIGLRIDQIDSTLLDLLDEFGGVRGKLAHSGARRVRQQPDPADVKKKVGEILARLEKLDETIAALP